MRAQNSNYSLQTSVSRVSVSLSVCSDELLVKQESRLQQQQQRAGRPHSTPRTLHWLQQHYEPALGACMPRRTLYMRYLEFCDTNDSQPVNPASFGKVRHLTSRFAAANREQRFVCVLSLDKL